MIKEVVRIIVVSTPACFFAIEKPTYDSTGNEGVRETKLLFDGYCEDLVVSTIHGAFSSVVARNRLTLSELPQTPPFPLEYSDFPMQPTCQRDSGRHNPPYLPGPHTFL